MNTEFPAAAVAPANPTNAPVKAPLDKPAIFAKLQADVAALRAQQAFLIQLLQQNAEQMVDQVELAQKSLGFEYTNEVQAVMGDHLVDPSLLDMNHDWATIRASFYPRFKL